MNKKFLTLLLVPFLASCSNNVAHKELVPPEVEDEHYYAFFMYNYPRTKEESSGGLEELIDNPLYYKTEIQLNTPFSKPTVDPERNYYEFQGWFKEKECETSWNFATDVASSSVYLYAKWGVVEEPPYIEPEYVAPEPEVITDADYRVKQIMNNPIVNGKVTLFKGAISRLNAHKEDVSFAINYAHKAGVSLTSATYNSSTNKVTVNFSSGDPFEATVEERVVALENSYHEQKAQNYENNGGDIEEHHIALVGSSSMENWTTSTEDMSPIVTFNHGIGGTTSVQWEDSLLERLVTPYSPKAVVYYVGVNDIINSNRTGAQTGTTLVNLFNKTHERLPNAQIFYILINKLPSYPHHQANFDTANAAALNYENSHSYLTCIDAGKGLLKPNGEPSWAYFVNDGLHMSKYGYVIWGKAVRDAIINWLG